MRYTIWFEKKNTNEKKNSWNDFNLLPFNRNKIIVGTPNYVTVDIEGMDGHYDWTNIDDYPIPFSRAEDEYQFYVVFDPVKERWIDRYTNLMKYFNGDVMDIWLDEVPDEVATGRVYISSWTSPADGYSEVTLKYTLTKEIEYV